jgi:hypothetical protein
MNAKDPSEIPASEGRSAATDCYADFKAWHDRYFAASQIGETQRQWLRDCWDASLDSLEAEIRKHTDSFVADRDVLQWVQSIIERIRSQSA